MNSKLIILGCGSSVGVPRIDGEWGNCNKLNKKNIRTRCSAIIIKGDNYILIDTSPDIKNQFTSNKLKKLTSVLFTHEHADQTNGLFELRPFYWKSKKKINIYANKKTILHLNKSHSYLFKKRGDYPPIVKANKVKPFFSLGSFKDKVSFQSIELKHGKIFTTAYIFEKTAYISDCNDLSIIKIKAFKNLNYLIIDCLKFSKHPSHFCLDEVLNIHQILKPKKTVLTNLHHDLDYNYLLKNLPTNIIPAYDGLKINLV